MDRNRNWQGWAALALAGLALLVALGGRGPFGFGPGRYVAVEQAPAAPAAPAAPQAPGFGRGGFEGRAEMERHMAEMERRMAQGEGRFAHGGPMMGHGGRGFERGWGGPFGFFPLFGLLRGLLNLAALGLLGYVIYTVWRQRRPAPAASGPAPTTPAGHDPRVE